MLSPKPSNASLAKHCEKFQLKDQGVGFTDFSSEFKVQDLRLWMRDDAWKLLRSLAIALSKKFLQLWLIHLVMFPRLVHKTDDRINIGQG